MLVLGWYGDPRSGNPIYGDSWHWYPSGMGMTEEERTEPGEELKKSGTRIHAG